MIYDYEVTTGTGESLSLADYKGKVILVVNTATGCGFTPQYERSSSCIRIITTWVLRCLTFHAISSADRLRERMRRYTNSVHCITIQARHCECVSYA